MQETRATIERTTQITPDLARLDIAAGFTPGSLQAGQYLLARPRPTWEPYLRARWVPVQIEGSILTIDRPAAERLAPGMVVDLLGPCGKPIPVRAGAERLLLIIEQTSPTQLIAFMRAAVSAGQSVTVVLDGEAQRYPLAELPRQAEILRAPAAWTWADQVDAVKWADQIIALAPAHQAGERYGALWQTLNQLRAPIPEGFVFGMFTGPVLCGVGACQACLVRARRGGDIHACTDGPALDLSRLII